MPHFTKQLWLANVKPLKWPYLTPKRKSMKSPLICFADIHMHSCGPMDNTSNCKPADPNLIPGPESHKSPSLTEQVNKWLTWGILNEVNHGSPDGTLALFPRAMSSDLPQAGRAMS